MNTSVKKCNHNYWSRRRTQKNLLVKYISLTGIESEIDPFCHLCQPILRLDAICNGQCSAYHHKLLPHIIQEVGLKMSQLEHNDHRNYDEFVYDARAYNIVHQCNQGPCRHTNDSGVVVYINNVHQEIEESLAAVKTNPASEEAIKALERFVTSNKLLQQQTTTSCAICLEDVTQDYSNKDGVGARMPCKHEFHEDCLLDWLRVSHYCPICRFELPTVQASTSS